MNPPDSSSSVSEPITAELLAIPQRGRILRFLTGAFACLTAACGMATLFEQLPPKCAAVGMLITTALLGLKDLVISVGDWLDDGKRNNSFGTENSEQRSANPAVLRQWFLILLIGCLCVGCASESSTDAEISRAQLALSGARITLVVAQSQFAAIQTDPKTPAWKAAAAAAAVSEAQNAVETESLRLRSIMASRNVARLNAPMTSAK